MLIIYLGLVVDFERKKTRCRLGRLYFIPMLCFFLTFLVRVQICVWCDTVVYNHTKKNCQECYIRKMTKVLTCTSHHFFKDFKNSQEGREISSFYLSAADRIKTHVIITDPSRYPKSIYYIIFYPYLRSCKYLFNRTKTQNVLFVTWNTFSYLLPHVTFSYVVTIVLKMRFTKFLRLPSSYGELVRHTKNNWSRQWDWLSMSCLLIHFFLYSTWSHKAHGGHLSCDVIW